jgi:acyl-CoA reductase-like NAD-dependent aldehyde dehydrogenase
MRNHGEFFAGGEWRSASGALLQVVNPATEEQIAVVATADAADVDLAVRAARAALEPWAATPLSDRLALLERVGELLTARRDELAATITRELGMPLTQSRETQIGWAVGAIADTVAAAAEALADERIGDSVVRRAPSGVAACITPWNFPIQQVARKVAEALAAGCPVVVKASELAPLSPLGLADCFREAGCPPGVFNLVSGDAYTGELLVTHPDVDVVSFTGSTRGGMRVAAIAAKSLKRLVLELGGKSPSVLLDEGLVERATRATVSNCFFNAGQVCTALTRFVVPRNVVGEVADLAAELAAAERLGDPLDAATTMGPLVAARQQERVLAIMDEADRTGARRLQGGPVPELGFYVAPTVYVDVDPASTLATEEVFGPVLAVIPYDGEDEAFAIANSGPYGLAARVWSSDRERALAAVDRLDAGQVGINDSPFDGRAPFGGFKHSGLGRAHGIYGVRAYTEVKAFPGNGA